MVYRPEHVSKPSRGRRLLRLLVALLILGGIAYLLLFAPRAPLGEIGRDITRSLSDVTDPLLKPDAAGTPDEIQARWEAEFGVGDAAFETAGPTATMLFRNSVRGLRSVLARDDRDKADVRRDEITKYFRLGRAYRERQEKKASK